MKRARAAAFSEIKQSSEEVQTVVVPPGWRQGALFKQSVSFDELQSYLTTQFKWELDETVNQNSLFFFWQDSCLGCENIRMS